MTSHRIWVDQEQSVQACFTNESKFFATFLLKVFPTEDDLQAEMNKGAEFAEALVKLIRAPTNEQT